MPLNKGNHIEKEIAGVKCRVVEENVSKERADFLEKLLKHNGFEVKIEQNPEAPDQFTVGVTDLLFNPVIYVYELRLKTFNSKIVTPAYWLQILPEGIEKGEEDYYWDLKPDENSTAASVR
ncbi:MAG: hypothetical protein GXO86_12805 [Chlorobi bacterium]|nr:hypothetical protein [Chlorobiota bacterium]